MPEIPEYIKFDFLITLIGIVIVGIMWYYLVILNIANLNVILTFVLGLIISVIGINEMQKNYFNDKRIKRLRYKLEELEIRKAIDKLERK